MKYQQKSALIDAVELLKKPSLLFHELLDNDFTLIKLFSHDLLQVLILVFHDIKLPFVVIKVLSGVIVETFLFLETLLENGYLLLEFIVLIFETLFLALELGSMR